MSGLRRVCVFCGSSSGSRRDYEDATVALGRLLVERDIGLVYGGAAVGLMGVLADSVLSGGGEVIGVIPEALVAKEIAHEGLTELRVVASMHERKAVMAELADAFIALPGGYGTFEETFEMITWTQLGLHDKAVGLLDVEGFFSSLAAFLDHAVAEGFVREPHRDLVVSDDDPVRLLDRLAQFEAPAVPKWIERSES
ncbi:MAG TPA: TIGR00730 family Rossman fold protein [Acidimicrobiales bacterium]|nr:TIGR00730 family Rossman fold protein [Acidimicrobiales bacterium]